MTQPSAAFRESGTGPAVLCLHANASSSSQWRALTELLAPRFRVLTADSYGAGKSPPPPSGGARLKDEVALLEPVLARAGERFSLVGHSYGGAVALVAATMFPERIHALALYEPTLFALVEAESPPPNDVDGIRNAVASAVAALGAGDAAGAARFFIDFWMGPSSFDRMPERNREAIAQAIAQVQGWKRALLEEPTPLSAFAALQCRVLLLTGSASPLSSRAVARKLASALPNVDVVELEGLGHMAPVTHPERVNARIVQFLEQHRS
jgi:pimeloyl-ACP methyl ester carboxylesterase